VKRHAGSAAVAAFAIGLASTFAPRATPVAGDGASAEAELGALARDLEATVRRIHAVRGEARLVAERAEATVARLADEEGGLAREAAELAEEIARVEATLAPLRTTRAVESLRTDRIERALASASGEVDGAAAAGRGIVAEETIPFDLRARLEGLRAEGPTVSARLLAVAQALQRELDLATTCETVPAADAGEELASEDEWLVRVGLLALFRIDGDDGRALAAERTRDGRWDWRPLGAAAAREVERARQMLAAKRPGLVSLPVDLRREKKP
jgi:hypothetical protein